LDGGDGWVRIGGGREIREELCSSEAGTRIAEIGSDFGEGYENKGALREAGMRNLEARLREDEIAVEENVEVEGAGAVGDSGGAITTEETFNKKEGGEEGARSERGFKSDDGIEEAGLISESDGGSGIQRRTHDDVSDGREVREGRGERGVGMAGRAGKVGAEGDVGEGHPGTRVASLQGSRASCVLASLRLAAMKVGKKKRPRRISTSRFEWGATLLSSEEG
jgi:hypothetical protein